MVDRLKVVINLTLYTCFRIPIKYLHAGGYLICSTGVM